MHSSCLKEYSDTKRSRFESRRCTVRVKKCIQMPREVGSNPDDAEFVLRVYSNTKKKKSRFES